jgi:hypothetical protein
LLVRFAGFLDQPGGGRVLLKSALKKTLRGVRFRGTRDMVENRQKSARSQGRGGHDAGLVPLDRYVEFILRTGPINVD